MPKRRKKQRQPLPRVYFCSRCGHAQESFRWQLIKRIRPVNRCTACGGNLVKKSELAPELRKGAASK